MSPHTIVGRATVALGLLAALIPDAHAADGEAVQSLVVAILLTAVGGAIVVRIVSRWCYEWLTQWRIRSTVRTFTKRTTR